jgi:hypothetical protein
MIAHLSDGNEEADSLYCCSLFTENPEDEEWVHCIVCLMWAHTHCADAEEPLSVSAAIQSNKKMPLKLPTKFL